MDVPAVPIVTAAVPFITTGTVANVRSAVTGAMFHPQGSRPSPTGEFLGVLVALAINDGPGLKQWSSRSVSWPYCSTRGTKRKLLEEPRPQIQTANVRTDSVLHTSCAVTGLLPPTPFQREARWESQKMGVRTAGSAACSLTLRAQRTRNLQTDVTRIEGRSWHPCSH